MAQVTQLRFLRSKLRRGVHGLGKGGLEELLAPARQPSADFLSAASDKREHFDGDNTCSHYELLF